MSLPHAGLQQRATSASARVGARGQRPSSGLKGGGLDGVKDAVSAESDNGGNWREFEKGVVMWGVAGCSAVAWIWFGRGGVGEVGGG